MYFILFVFPIIVENLLCFFASEEIMACNPIFKSIYILKKMHPTLKTSAAQVCLVFFDLRLAISGAIKPGVPHLRKMYSFASAGVASPKSISTHSSSPFYVFLIMMFSGLRSLWMMFFCFISMSAASICFMNCFCCLTFRFYFICSLRVVFRYSILR